MLSVEVFIDIFNVLQLSDSINKRDIIEFTKFVKQSSKSDV